MTLNVLTNNVYQSEEAMTRQTLRDIRNILRWNEDSTPYNYLIRNSAGPSDMVNIVDGGDGFPVKNLTVNVEPGQDLHGYDHPWAGGAGKNLLNINATTQTINGVTFTVNSNGTVLVNGTATANTDFMLSNSSFSIPAGHYILSGSPQGGTNTTYYLAFFVDSSWQNRDYGNGLDKQVNTSITNAAISVRNGTTINNLIFKPMIRLASNTDPTFEPYSNICPITGHTGAVLTRTGKNLLPMTVDSIKNLNTEGVWSGNVYSLYGGTFTLQTDNGDSITGIIINGTFTATILLNLYLGTNPTDYNGLILSGFSGGSGGTGLRISDTVYQSNYNYSGATTIANLKDTGRLTVVIRVDANRSFNNSVVKPMIRVATDADSTFEPYQGQVYNVTFPDAAGTVYGGVLDVTNGTLTVNKAYVDLGDLSWNYQSAEYRFWAILSDVKNYSTWETANLVCSQYRTHAWQGKTNGDIYSQGGYIGVNDLRYTDAASFKTAVAGTQLVYEIADPITYILTPQEITTLLGINHISADVGKTVVEYVADPKLYIDNAIANAVANALSA